MAHPRQNATGHVIYDEGEKILSTDLEYMGAMAEQAVLHLFGRLVEGVLRVRRCDEAGAVSLADRLAERPGVRSSRVEHVWGRS